MEKLRKESVRLLPVIKLVVVRARINVFMTAKGIVSLVERKEGANLLVDIRLYERCQEAAIVLLIVNQQRGPGSPHRNKKRVVEAAQQVGSRLFHLLSIRGPGQIRFHRTDSRNLDHHTDPFI